MLTEDYIVRMIRDMGQMLARVLGSPAIRQMAANAKLDDRINTLTMEVWRRPSRDPAPQMY